METRMRHTSNLGEISELISVVTTSATKIVKVTAEKLTMSIDNTLDIGVSFTHAGKVFAADVDKSVIGRSELNDIEQEYNDRLAKRELKKLIAEDEAEEAEK